MLHTNYGHTMQVGSQVAIFQCSVKVAQATGKLLIGLLFAKTTISSNRNEQSPGSKL